MDKKQPLHSLVAVFSKTNYVRQKWAIFPQKVFHTMSLHHSSPLVGFMCFSIQ
jgi:hypothetical protein